MTAKKHIAIITGTSRGLGLTLAQTFAAGGWQVVGTGRSPRPDELPEGADYHQFDASGAAACETFWHTITETYPAGTFCLINNAGAYVSGGLAQTPPEDFAQQMDANYFSAVYMTRGLVTAVPQARIINVVSASALVAHKNNSAYGAAKAAAMHFFHSLQQEFPASQYRITNLYPQSIATEGPDPQATDPKDLAAFILECAESNASYYLRDVTIYPQPA